MEDLGAVKKLGPALPPRELNSSYLETANLALLSALPSRDLSSHVRMRNGNSSLCILHHGIGYNDSPSIAAKPRTESENIAQDSRTNLDDLERYVRSAVRDHFAKRWGREGKGR